MAVSVLADRYASAEMRKIFSAESKIIAERDLWLAVARAQKKLGHAITEDQIAAYEKVKAKVDLTSIDQRERTTRDRKSTRLNSSHVSESRMPSSA